MRELVLFARPNVLLRENGRHIAPGQPFAVSDARAEELLTDPLLDFREVESGGLQRLSRTALDELAREQGHSDPESLKNKQAVIDLIEGRESEPGDGQEVMK